MLPAYSSREPAAPPASVGALARALRDGSLPLLDYLGKLQDRFQVLEPEVMAFLPEEGRFDRLRREAVQLLQQYPEPASRPPLFGVPVGVKDIFHVQGMTTRAGTNVPSEELQGGEAAVVTALKQAGVLILGKTVTTEFAYFAPGPTRNPHNLSHTPGGSSSGSAAAVAAGLSPLALGTQTIGSIVRPAAYCGVAGFKPSYDRISREGVLPLSPSLDHVGFFTADVPSASRVAGLLCAQWQPAAPARQPVLAIPRGPYLEHASPEGLKHFHEVCEKLAQVGLTVKVVETLADFDDIALQHKALMAAEAAAVHATRFARYDNLYHAKTAALLTQGEMVPSEIVESARAGRMALRERLQREMATGGFDLWIAPAAPGPAPAGLESTGDPILNLPWTYAGLPVVSVPSGRSEAGLPLAVQLVAGWYADEELLAWATGLEKLLRRLSE